LESKSVYRIPFLPVVIRVEDICEDDAANATDVQPTMVPASTVLQEGQESAPVVEMDAIESKGPAQSKGPSAARLITKLKQATFHTKLRQKLRKEQRLMQNNMEESGDLLIGKSGDAVEAHSVRLSSKTAEVLTATMSQEEQAKDLKNFRRKVELATQEVQSRRRWKKEKFQLTLKNMEFSTGTESSATSFPQDDGECVIARALRLCRSPSKRASDFSRLQEECRSTKAALENLRVALMI